MTHKQFIIDIKKQNEYFLFANNNYTTHEVAILVNFQAKNFLSIHKLGEFIKNKILGLVTGPEIKTEEYNKIIDYFFIIKYTHIKDTYKNSRNLFYRTRAILGAGKSYTNDIEKWKEASLFISYYVNICGDVYFISDNRNFELKNIAKSIKFLSKKGILISSGEDGNFLTEAEETKILEKIQYRANTIGSYGLTWLLDDMYLKRDNKINRYIFRSEPDITNGNERDIPYGFLYNIFISKVIFKIKADKKIYNEIVEISMSYLSLARLQNYSKFNTPNHTHDSIIEGIVRNIKYDQQYTIDQFNNSHFLCILKILTEYFYGISRNNNFKQFYTIANRLSINSQKNAMLLFSEIDYIKISHGTADKSTKFLLDLLSHDTPVNTGYIAPNNITNRNYYKKPLLKIDSKYLYVNPDISNYGFYEQLIKYATKTISNEKIINDSTEYVLSKILSQSNIEFMQGKKYTVDKAVRTSLNITSKERECDFIIETADFIIFIELKKKTLTSDARMGSEIDIIQDLSKSMLHALAQSGVHEYILRTFNIINFTDNSTIKLNSRKIIRIASTFFDFYSLQDHSFVNKMILLFLTGTLTSHSQKIKTEEINRYVDEIKRQEQFFVPTNTQEELKNRIMNYRFLSVPQLITILTGCNSNEEFAKNLNKNRNISIETMDWYYDFYHINKILNR